MMQQKVFLKISRPEAFVETTRFCVLRCVRFVQAHDEDLVKEVGGKIDSTALWIFILAILNIQ